MDYETIKWIHIVSSALLFGTGLGSAFYKWQADRSGNLEVMSHTNRTVVLADWIFTTPTIIIQPLTGLMLTSTIGIPLTEPWLVVACILYIIAAGCWLPVVWLQIQMRNSSLQALQLGKTLDRSYTRNTRYWFWLGVPAFASMLAIYFLMVFKPAIDF